MSTQMQSDYQVGVDLGTTWTAAAVCRADGPDGGRTVDVVPLGERAAAVPSAVFLGEDGVFVIGEAAQRRALSDPGRVVEEFKRRIGDRTPLVLGGVPVAPETLAARFVAQVLQHVAAREGGPAAGVAVTHPAGWGPHKLASLRAALDAEGMTGAVLLAEPQAAAIGYANLARVDAGATVAVYDLGGGTFDTAVVRKCHGGGFELLGRPEGIERLGGVDFDEAVFSHVHAGLAWDTLDPSDPAVLAAVAALRQECTAAKEALSHDTEVTIPVLLPGMAHTRVRLERSAFEEMIRPAVAETVAALLLAIGSADLAPGEQPVVLLVGGSSRIPLVAELVAAGTGRPVALDVDPKAVIAMGAALAAGSVADDATAPLVVPVVAVLDVEGPPAGPSPVDGPVPAGSFPISGVRPFRDTGAPVRPRPAVAIGVALAIVAAIALAGGLLSGIYRSGAAIGPVADASTPAVGTPATTVPLAVVSRPADPGPTPSRPASPLTAPPVTSTPPTSTTPPSTTQPSTTQPSTTQLSTTAPSTAPAEEGVITGGTEPAGGLEGAGGAAGAGAPTEPAAPAEAGGDGDGAGVPAP